MEKGGKDVEKFDKNIDIVGKKKKSLKKHLERWQIIEKPRKILEKRW